ncbi:hypothetical protein WA158_008367 [Blastocystis sp. Blastoise]
MNVLFSFVFDITMSIPSIKLSSGYMMPIFGLGTWKSEPQKIHDSVIEAIKLGYRLFDCAAAYSNEQYVGEAIKEAIDNGLVKREELFISTKLWCTDFAPENVSKAFAQSKKNLQVDYLDLYLIHWPFEYATLPEDEAKRDPNNWFSVPFFNERRAETRLGWNVDRMTNTWRELEKLVEKGEIRSIGVSNFTVKKLKEFLPHCNILPCNNQVELHPSLQQWNLFNFCKEHNIYLTAYAPLVRPDPNNTDPNKIAPTEDPRVIAIGKKYNKSPAQICIRWAIQRGTICIPKTTTLTRLVENMNIFDFSLTEEEMNEIKQLDQGRRCVLGDSCLPPELTYKDCWDGEDCN